jgi:Zn-finger nucleic acid-binding protein
MILDICYGGCGGIWFDASELGRVEGRAAASLHTVWQTNKEKRPLTEPRPCPKCPDQILERKLFSDTGKVEIDQCPQCGGIWLDDGEFSLIYKEMKLPGFSAPELTAAMAEAAAFIKTEPAVKTEPAKEPPNA